jgi:hypothetical protein
LTSRKPVLKYREIRELPANLPLSPVFVGGASGFMTSKSPSPSQNAGKPQPCKHLRVQIVSRDEDAEFVECKECGEIFESSEFKDMSIEERTTSDDV